MYQVKGDSAGRDWLKVDDADVPDMDESESNLLASTLNKKVKGHFYINAANQKSNAPWFTNCEGLNQVGSALMLLRWCMQWTDICVLTGVLGSCNVHV